MVGRQSFPFGIQPIFSGEHVSVGGGGITVDLKETPLFFFPRVAFIHLKKNGFQSNRLKQARWVVSNIFLVFTPKIGEDFHPFWRSHIFQMGWWKNHQPMFLGWGGGIGGPVNLRQKPTVFPWDFLPFALEKLGILKLKRKIWVWWVEGVDWNGIQTVLFS